MSDSFNLYTFLSLFVCLLIGVFFAWLLYGKTKDLDKRLRYGLAAARAVVVTAIGFLLCFPLIRSVSYNPEKPIIVIGQDNSLSVGNITPVGFNKPLYEQQMQRLAKQLSEQFEVRIYNFSDSVKTGFDFSNTGKLSNAAQLITKLNDEYLNRNIGAVILASDGIFNRGGSPLYELNKLKAPVYTIALGDTVPKRDLLIANINHNSLVYRDNDFTIEVQAQAFETKGAESQLSVSTNGKKVYEERLSVTSDAFVKNIPVKLKATGVGLQKYTVQLSPVQHEISEKNNVQHIFIDVIDAKQKVLIAAAGPHPDITALRQAISLQKNFEVKVALAEELNALRPEDYGLVILYQLPSMGYDASAFINKLGAVNVAVWHILGAKSNINVFNQLQKQVRFSGSNNTLQETFSDANAGFTAFDLDKAMAKQIAGFDPLQAPFGNVIVNGNSAVVLNQRIGKIHTDYPQLFFMVDNGKKTGFLIGEGLWRWKLSEAGDAQQEPMVFNSLISKIVQYLSVKDDKRKFKVYAAKNTFDENENVLLNAVLYNDSYASVNAPDVSITLKNDAGKAFKFLFSRTDAAYQLDAGTLPAGNYTYSATTVLGNKNYAAQGIFYVNAMVAEYQQTVANHQLLNTMSAQTGGKMYMPQDLLKLVDVIKSNDQIKTLSYEDRKYEELINFKWLFLLIMALLTIEWFFRKRNGEI
ncbi:VWA domain-containing protein [Pedobacter hiemivivus]|uniref:VWA domain-containing protein n=1 Tax=Pedobacter hiemivivus TaxID=2530454 RepID=A0A4U1GBC3_9SPHI|nr:vWA domain-containing protein [Pedobacter hiemivivus]TKC61207.1 VWA domain-containing protein [Pedobacter hiemivivus]